MSLSSDDRLSWIVTALAGFYATWTAYFLSRRIPLFGAMFSSLGAELPLPTRVVLAMGTPIIIWSCAGAVLVILVIKELRYQQLRTRVMISTIIFMVVACASSLVMEALFQPMMSLIRQVG